MTHNGHSDLLESVRRMQVLLVEDDNSLASGLCKALRSAGFSVNRVANGSSALHVMAAEPPEIVILDLGLPDMDGLDILRRLRQSGSPIPVLVLTARASIDARVTGLDLGADDYLPKPFEIPELIARLRVIERRLSNQVNSTIRIGDVELDTLHREISFRGHPIQIARQEYALLKSLMENSGKILTREQLESRLYTWGKEISSNAIEVHVHHLRRKLGNDFIKTVRGVGYTIRKS